MCYDRLSRVVFGNSLVDAQVYLLPAIPPGASVLIVGGGTGWILESIAELHSSGLRIDYVEVSSAMIQRAKKRNAGSNKVNFINESIEDAPFDGVKYDVVITPFLFDNFTDANMRRICSVISSRLNAGGVWLYCDFRNTDNVRQRLLLKVMYAFFRLACGVQASKLPDTEDWFSQHYYHPIAQKTFMNGFIVSSIYKIV